RALEDTHEQPALQLAADERSRQVAAEVRAEASTSGRGKPERDWSGLALHDRRLKRLVVEGVFRGGIRALPHDHSVNRRHSLEARGGVDHVAGHEALTLLGPRF